MDIRWYVQITNQKNFGKGKFTEAFEKNNENIDIPYVATIDFESIITDFNKLTVKFNIPPRILKILNNNTNMENFYSRKRKANEMNEDEFDNDSS